MTFKIFPKETYIQRRNQLKSEMKTGYIILLGNDQSSMNFKDNWYHFRQDSTFLYYFGINLPNLTAIIDIDNDVATIFGNELTIDQIIWNGDQPTIKELANRVGIEKTSPISKLYYSIRTAISKGQEIHFLKPYRNENKNKISDWSGIKYAHINAHVSLKLSKAIIKQRSYKTDEEIAEIEKAVTITGDMHITAMKCTKPGIIESHIVAKLNEVVISAGGRLSFPAIFTKDGQIIHNHNHSNILKENDLVLCDAGAENNMSYAGDMTRTFPAGKSFTLRQKELYEIVLNAHEVAVSALKPGILYKDVHLLACKELTKGLKEVNLMKGDVDQAVANGAHAMFFQCGLGHMMGLDVHDMEDLGEQYVGYINEIQKSTQFGLKSLRLGRALENRFVITVEPGIYIIPQLIDMWKAENKHADFINYELLETYKDFGGIRIEEDFLITESGSRLLGKHIPKTVNEIEAIKQGLY